MKQTYLNLGSYFIWNAYPKSDILAFRSLVTIMLFGLISRWHIPFYFKKSKPFTVCYISLTIVNIDIDLILALIYFSKDKLG